jgi:DNA-binding NarL/FixJ family response regulator
MNSPRVFLICFNQLVCEAVNAVLRREGIVLVGMETDPDAALVQVDALSPDIVLVEGLDSAQPATRLMAELARRAYEKENLRILQLSLPDDELRIYYQKHRRVMNGHDLVTAIRSSTLVASE